MNTLNPREAAFSALKDFLKDEVFLSESLSKWKTETKKKIPSKDFHLAEEIAYGTCRRLLSLEYLACQISGKKKLKLKVKEKALLYSALYQHFFMDRVPLFAIANESVLIAKKHCYVTFANFLNAILRKLENQSYFLPENDSIESLTIRYSLPKFVVKKLIGDYEIGTVKKIFTTSNIPSKTTVRVRDQISALPEGLTMLDGESESFAQLDDSSQLHLITSSPSFYIQNSTPYLMMKRLSETVNHPIKSIIDLCASPGGKTLAAHEFYPDATIVSNDVSEEKIVKLQENLAKYNIPATTSISHAEEISTDQKFDLVIIDAPCSNSGVLNKRPEARWRLSKDNLNELLKIQTAIFEKGVSLLNPGGKIWYLTCSILKMENEQLINQMAESLNLNILEQHTILPSSDSLLDGGYGCSLEISK